MPMKTPDFVSNSTILFCILTAALAQPAWADVTLHLTIDTHNEPSTQTAAQAANIPPDTHKSLDVTLADGYILAKSDTEAVIYDFKTRRRIAIDTAAKTYVDYSLYDVVGFRALEAQNRDNLRKMLAAAKVDAPLLAKIDTEQSLSLQSATPEKIDVAEGDDGVRFSNAGKELAHWGRKGAEVDATDAARFAQLLRYVDGGHPQILDKLGKSKAIPDTLVFNHGQIWGPQTHTITVAGVRTIKASPYDLHGYAKRQAGATSASEQMDDILDKAGELSMSGLAAAKAANRAQSEKDIKAGKILDAMLGSIEWNLMTGEQAPPFAPDQQAKVHDDPVIQNISKLLVANTKEGLTEAAKAFAELRPKATHKAYVLAIFEANDRLRIGEAPAARKLMREALLANPYLAGAYKDLGDAFVQQLDTARAWRCWDAGRRLAPQFANFKAIDQFEKTLVAQHPEYF
jgi:hypothetical protein